MNECPKCKMCLLQKVEKGGVGATGGRKDLSAYKIIRECLNPNCDYRSDCDAETRNIWSTVAAKINHD
jgi:hypothetical protein